MGIGVPIVSIIMKLLLRNQIASAYAIHETIRGIQRTGDEVDN